MTRTPAEPLADGEMIETVAAAMQKARDEIGATEQQRIAFGYAEAAMREALSAYNPNDRLREALEGGTISQTSFDGHAVRIDFETRAEAKRAVRSPIS